MGIELPGELTEIAVAAGVSWPQADEDLMRVQAAAWRAAGDQLTALATEADAGAGRALGAMSGTAGDAARALWSSFADPDLGQLGAAARGAADAAERLEHAATEIATAKVELVRHLVDAAKNRDAAVASGDPNALLGLDTALRASAVNLAAVTDGLADAVGPVDAAPVSTIGPVIDANPGVHTTHGQSSLLSAITGLPESALNPVEPLADDGTGPIQLGASGQYGGLLHDGGFDEVATPPSGTSLAGFADHAPIPPGAQHFQAGPPPAPVSYAPQPVAPPMPMHLPPVPPPMAAAAPVPPPPVARPLGAPRMERESVVALFLVHMFPIGHLPVAADRPARQLPVPSPEFADASGLRFTPDDHPASSLIDGSTALANVVAGFRRAAAPPAIVAPASLTDGHDPFGGLRERDWARRFFAGQRTFAPEFAWPPGELHPEGCGAPGEPVMLPEDLLIDRFGGDGGRIFAPDATPFAHRSLPHALLGQDYRRYRVLRELPMWRGVSAAWFGQPGGGVRYRATRSADELVTLGYLADITGEDGV